MDILKYIFLGILQGLTEFLPVSSSGHLVLFEKLGVVEPSLFFNLVLHVATLLAVFMVLRKDVWEWIKHPFSKEAVWIYILSIPTVIISIVSTLWLKDLLLGKYLPTGFFITSAVLFMTTIKIKDNKDLTYKNALITGIAQGIAILPGVSRSGITIATMQLQGITREKAVILSFLMSIPVIIGGALFEGIKEGVGDYNTMYLLIGGISAFLSGVFALKVMVKFFAKLSFAPFAIYTFLLGIIALILL